MIIRIVQENQPIRAKDLYRNAMKDGNMSNATVYKHVRDLVDQGVLRRNPKSHKEVEYKTTEDAEFELLLREWEKNTTEFFRDTYSAIDDDQLKREFLKAFEEAIESCPDYFKILEQT